MREWGPAATARLLLSPSAVESTPVLQDSQLFDPSEFGYFRILPDLDIFGYFSAGSYCWGQLSAGGHTESTRLFIGPGLITWALGCTFFF